MKTYEKAFFNELRAIEPFGIEPTYTDGVPDVECMKMQVGKSKTFDELIKTFKDEPEQAAAFDYLFRTTMSPFWKACGRPIFNITPELAAALILTELPSKIEVMPPFPAFMLSIQVREDQKTPLIVDEVEYFGLSFFHCGDSWMIWGFPRWESEQSHFQKIHDYKDDLHKHCKEHPGSVLIHRLLVNLCAYISAKKSSGQMPKAKRGSVGSRKGTSVTHLGKDVKLPYNMVSVARGETDPQYKINKRFVVRGHFRNQPYGPKGDKKTKVVWIQPFWKGPDILEATERTYTVK